MTDDGFFAPLENERPYLKAAFQGFAGSGKTFTSALLAAGLHKRIGSSKPIVIFDTEGSAKFLRPFFRTHGIQALRKGSRSLPDLVETIRRCEKGAADIILIDSITHVWEDYIEAFKRERRVEELRFQHWGTIKPVWKRNFADPFVTSQVHIIMTGRAAFEYSNEKDPDTQKRELVKTGTKMRVEGETAYEPDLLVEMQRFEVFDPKAGGVRRVWREAMVLKDRSTLLDGKTAEDPQFAFFAPTVDVLLSDAAPPRPANEADAAELFSDDQREESLQRKIVLEEIEGLLVKAAPGQTAKERKWKIDTLYEQFGTGSWTKVKLLPVERLIRGKDAIALRTSQMREERDGSQKEDQAYEHDEAGLRPPDGPL